MHVRIRQIGNSPGVVIPKPVLAQLGLNGEAGAEMTIEGDALVLRRPASPARTGWAEAASKITHFVHRAFESSRFLVCDVLPQGEDDQLVKVASDGSRSVL